MAAKNKIICSVLLALLGLGFYDVFRNFEENGCAMTYMFQWPSYIDIKMDGVIQQQCPQYSLLLYGEGDYLKQSRNLKLNGIPVVFIPGNAGSYKQVRSLGSVSLRKAQAYSFHFNYFTIDFNEELTGIYGGTIQQQTEYVRECINHILTLYKHKKHPPASVILVGHSMGGVIARSLFTLPDFQPSLVHTVITQATPHESPVIGADKYLVDFYSTVNQYWRQHINDDGLKDVTLLSVSGGHRDTMVRSGLTSLHDIVPSNRSLSVNAMSVPRVWLSTDHQCVVWCKELVLATKRALFQMVDSQTKQISTDPDFRMNVLRHHFVAHNGREKFSTTETKPKTFEGATFELATNSHRYSVGRRSKKTIHYLFAVEQSNISHNAFTALAGIEPRDWLFVCQEGDSTSCSRGVDISATARLMPPLKANMKSAVVNLDAYPNAKHVVLKVPSGSMVPVTAELYDMNQRHVNFTIPGPFSGASASLAVEFTDVGATFYNITMIDFNLFHLAYEAQLEPISCDPNLHSDANSTLRLHIPWAEGQDTYSVAKAGHINKLSLKLPSGWPSHSNQSAQLFTYLNPQCRYTIRVVWSLQDKMGQVVRFHANLLPNFIVVVLVFIISFQLKHIYTEKAIDDFIWMQSTHCKPNTIALAISIFRGIVKYEPLDKTFDLRSFEDKNIFFSIFPLVFFMFGYALLTQLALLASLKVQLCARLAVFVRGTKADEHQLNLAGPTPWLMYGIIGGLVALSATTCGTLGLMAALVMYFFKVVGLKAKVLRLSHCLNIHGAIIDLTTNATSLTTEEVESSVKNDDSSSANNEDVQRTKPDDAAPKPRDLSPLGLASSVKNEDSSSTSNEEVKPTKLDDAAPKPRDLSPLGLASSVKNEDSSSTSNEDVQPTKLDDAAPKPRDLSPLGLASSVKNEDSSSTSNEDVQPTKLDDAAPKPRDLSPLGLASSVKNEDSSSTSNEEVKPTKLDDAAPKPRDLSPLGLASSVKNEDSSSTSNEDVQPTKLDDAAPKPRDLSPLGLASSVKNEDSSSTSNEDVQPTKLDDAAPKPRDLSPLGLASSVKNEDSSSTSNEDVQPTKLDDAAPKPRDLSPLGLASSVKNEDSSSTSNEDVQPTKPDDAAPKPRDLSPLGLAKETYNFHFAIMLLLWCLCILNAPSLIVWFKNLGYSLHLSKDPSMYIAAVVCSTMVVMLDGRYTIPTCKGLCKLSSWLFLPFLWLIVLYTLQATYLVSYIICAVFVILSVLQIYQ